MGLRIMMRNAFLLGLLIEDNIVDRTKKVG
jgi:hypothetical protein